jgi:putative ABC transport system substrate-binding protein
MRRRGFIILLGGAAAAWPLSPYAQSRLPRIGVLLFGHAVSPGDLRIAHELARIGYVDGQNVTYVVRVAEGDVSRLPLLARDLAAAKPDVIVGQSSPAAIALFNATHEIPIVMTVVGDPIALNLTSSISHPTHNLTGFTISSPSLAAKRLQLLQSVFPSLHKVAYLWGPENPFAKTFEANVRRAANALGIELISLPLKSEADIDDAFTRAQQDRAEAVLVEADPLILRFTSSIVDHCLLYGLPAMHAWAIEVRNGALMSYGPSSIENNSGAATYVDRILKGTKVSELPFVEPTEIKLVINLRTARSLGVVLPSTLLVRADEVIE